MLRLSTLLHSYQSPIQPPVHSVTSTRLLRSFAFSTLISPPGCSPLCPHQRGAIPKSKDGLYYHQHQVILRDTGSPHVAAWQFMKVACMELAEKHI